MSVHFTEKELRDSQRMARNCMQVLVRSIVDHPDMGFAFLLKMLEHLDSARGLMEESVRELQKMGLGPEERGLGN